MRSQVGRRDASQYILHIFNGQTAYTVYTRIKWSFRGVGNETSSISQMIEESALYVYILARRPADVPGTGILAVTPIKNEASTSHSSC